MNYFLFSYAAYFFLRLTTNKLRLSGQFYWVVKLLIWLKNDIFRVVKNVFMWIPNANGVYTKEMYFINCLGYNRSGIITRGQ